MNLPVVLDAQGLEALSATRPPEPFRALLAEAWRRQKEIFVPAVVCAECCRGSARTCAVESSITRHRPDAAQQPPVQIVETDFDLARSVGALLYAASASSADMVDAHVVAVAAHRGGALVVTGDPVDIMRLAEGAPGARITVRTAS